MVSNSELKEQLESRALYVQAIGEPEYIGSPKPEHVAPVVDTMYLAIDRITELEAENQRLRLWMAEASHHSDCGWRKVPCPYCEDRGWHEDEGWDRYEFGLPGKDPAEGDGLLPCICNDDRKLLDEFVPTDGACTCGRDALIGADDE